MFKLYCNTFKNTITENSSDDIFVYWMNIGVESRWMQTDDTIFPVIRQSDDDNLIKSMEQMLYLIKTEQDIVIVRKKPDYAVTRSLSTLGISVDSTWISPGTESISSLILKDITLLDRLKKLSQTQKVTLVPYIISEEDIEISKITGCPLLCHDSQLIKWINNKNNVRKLCGEMDIPLPEGRVCTNIKQLEEQINDFRKRYKPFVIKNPFGASGNGLFIVNDDKSYAIVQHYLKKKKRKSDTCALLIEEWISVKKHFNYQMLISEKANYNFSLSTQFVDDGRYWGSKIIEQNQFDHQQNEVINRTASMFSDFLSTKGYRGIISFDAILDNAGKIYPVVEINGRFSLSSYLTNLFFKLGGRKIIQSRYFDIFNTSAAEFKQVSVVLLKEGYSNERGYGICIYAVSVADDYNSARFFLLYIANTEEMINKLYNFSINIFSQCFRNS